MIESVRPEKSAEWYGHASEVVLLEDRYLQAAEYANKAVRMYLKLRQYDSAIEYAGKALENYTMASENRCAGREISTMVIIHLARDDPIAAQKVYIANKGYGSMGQTTIIAHKHLFIDCVSTVDWWSTMSDTFWTISFLALTTLTMLPSTVP